MPDQEKSKIVFIGGYPHVVGVNVPSDPPAEPSLDQQVLEDAIWDATTPLKGWAKVQAFLNRVFGGGE
jgi:hypothetical protein